jgi:thioredoxin reductase
MAVDTPAKIAILGAGPIGLEAALYARYLGYEVDVFERGEIAAGVNNWGHVELFTPFGMNSSPLAIAALQAQNPAGNFPKADELLTGNQWRERYLLPLAESDLLHGSIHLQTTVVAVAKDSSQKTDSPGSEDRGDELFRVLVKNADGEERVALANIVIDATGVTTVPNHLGRGGIPAIGEEACREFISYDIPKFDGHDRELYAGKKVLVVGRGYSAATSIVKLSEIAEQNEETKIHWLTRPTGNESSVPIQVIENDRLGTRTTLAEQSNAAAEKVERLANCFIESIKCQDGQLAVTLGGEHEGEFTFDRLIANVGYRGDVSFTSEMQVHRCYATDGPIKLAVSLMSSESADCLDQPAGEAELLLNPEANFYILGAKSYGRNSQFLLANGLKQIQQLFTIIGDREDLDLYETMKNLIQ